MKNLIWQPVHFDDFSFMVFLCSDFSIFLGFPRYSSRVSPMFPDDKYLCSFCWSWKLIYRECTRCGSKRQWTKVWAKNCGTTRHRNTYYTSKTTACWFIVWCSMYDWALCYLCLSSPDQVKHNSSMCVRCCCCCFFFFFVVALYTSSSFFFARTTHRTSLTSFHCAHTFHTFDTIIRICVVRSNVHVQQ